MPRETIRRLSADLDRLLVAGAHLASSDAGLARSKTALDQLAIQLGGKAPVIAQLAAAAGKTISAGNADVAREVVSLATMTAQIRAAQAQPAPVPAHEALPPRPEIGSPCNAKELGELHTALVESGKGRLERVQQSIERGDIADLRLVEAVIFAMHDNYIGDLVAEQAVPRLGPAIIAPIRSQLTFEKGRRVDGRRLRALVAVDPAGSRELVQRALAEGSAEVREAALNAIADHLRGAPEFEQPVLGLVTKERSGDVFRAALRALAGYASDATLEALTTALSDSRTLEAAAEGLGHSRHPKALPWMLERLGEAVAAATSARKKPDGSSKPPANAVQPADMAAALLRALAHQKDPNVAAAAMPLIDDFGATAANAALASADGRQLQTIADFLSGDDEDLFPVAAAAAVRLGLDQAFKRLSSAFAAKDRHKKAGLARLQAVCGQLTHITDRRWADVALDHLDDPPPVAVFAIPLLGKLKEPRARKPLLKLIDKARAPELLAAAIEALGNIGDSSCVPAMLAHHAAKHWGVRWAIQNAVLAINDPATVDQVRSLWVSLGETSGYDHWHLRSLLRTLEQRFPGK